MCAMIHGSPSVSRFSCIVLCVGLLASAADPAYAAPCQLNQAVAARGAAAMVFAGVAAAVDTTPPQVAISVPSSSDTYVSSQPTLSIGGSASDNVEVTAVTWANSRGGSGSCTGLVNWTKTGIPLQPGLNVITVTARDAANNTAADVLGVTYTPADVILPTITMTNPRIGCGYSYSPIQVSGAASDSGDYASGLALVQVRVNGGGWIDAAGTGAWECWVQLTSSQNTIEARAKDNAGNYSAPASVTTTYFSAPPVTPTGPDADGDGVADADDLCPGTVSGFVVDADGCSAAQRDSDGDGVKDDVDLCPGTASEVVIDPTTGCPFDNDADLDGVVDDIDRCPNTPAGEMADNLGCSSSQIDTDNDDVPDSKDGCPLDPAKLLPGECGCGMLETAGCGQQVTLRISTSHSLPTGAPGPQVYPVGVTLSLWAPMAPNGYHFDCWSGDINCTNNPASVVMDSDKLIRANYVADEQSTDEQDTGSPVPDVTPATPACGAGAPLAVLMASCGLTAFRVRRR